MLLDSAFTDCAYRVEGEPGVRVLVMIDRRLRELDYAIDATRHYLLQRGPRED